MAFDLRTILAFLVGGVLVVTAFWLRPEPTDRAASISDIEQSAARNFIPVKDSDNNGVPDWQEVFAVNTIDLDQMTAGASTSTLTGQVISSLADYLMSGTSPEEALALIGSELTAGNIDVQFGEADIKANGDNSQAALHAYGNAVAVIAESYPLPANTKDEITVLNEAFLYNDPKTLESLDPIISAYEGMRDDMLELSVPSSMSREHLSLINVYNALAIDIRGFSNVYNDALTSTLRLRRYPSDAVALQAAISNLYVKLHQNGIQWSDDDAVAKFVEIDL